MRGTDIVFGLVYEEVEDKGYFVGGRDGGTIHTRKPC